MAEHVELALFGDLRSVLISGILASVVTAGSGKIQAPHPINFNSLQVKPEFIQTLQVGIQIGDPGPI